MNAIKPDVTKDRLRDEFNAVVNETEQLLSSVATLGSEQAGVLKGNVDQALASASAQVERIREQALARTRATIAATDEYVHSNPWQAIGIAAGLAGLAG